MVADIRINVRPSVPGKSCSSQGNEGSCTTDGGVNYYSVLIQVMSNYNPTLFLLETWRLKGFIKFDININVLVSSFRLI